MTGAVTQSGDGNRQISSLLLAVFFASGVSALLYQVIWQRILALFSGADVLSVTIIVSAFMGGLGCGNLAGGHLADRLSRWRCLMFFAIAELAVALFALGSKAFYYDFLYARHSALAQSTPLLALALFLSVLWPTFFMGLSLPLLARGLTDAIRSAARSVGALYGYNTLGAATGAFLTTWILLRHFGFESCLQIGAAINIACAASAIPLGLALRRTSSPERCGESLAVVDAAPPPVSPTGAAVFTLPQWLLIYALSGALALSLEIAWFRVLGVMLKSTSFTFGTLLTIYLSGVAIGSIVGSRWLAGGSRDPVTRFLVLQIAVGVYAAVSLALLLAAVDGVSPLWTFFGGSEPVAVGEAIADLTSGPLGVLWSESPAGLFVALYVALPLILIGPPTIFMGLSFPYLQKAVQTDATFLGRRVGWLQTANIVGSLVGSVLTGFVLLPWLGTSATFRLVAGATGSFAFLWLRARKRSGAARSLTPPTLAFAAILLGVAVVPRGDALWPRLHGVAAGRVLYREDESGVALMRPARRERDGFDGIMVMAGGLSLSWIPFGGMHTVLGAVPLMLHPNPKRIAVIGLGSGDTAYAFTGRPEVEEVVAIEILGSELELLRAFDARRRYPALRSLLTDPRVRFVAGDGRTHIRGDRQKYDLIEADALRPSSSYSGNLYSLEYFALLRESLKPGGMAVTWVPTRRVLHTFLQSFPYVLILESRALLEESMAIGSKEPIRYDGEALLAALDTAYIRAHYRRARVDIKRLISDYLAKWTPRFVGPEDDRAQFSDVNSDLFPKDEFMVVESIP